jgi:hypothetical protein
MYIAPCVTRRTPAVILALVCALASSSWAHAAVCNPSLDWASDASRAETEREIGTELGTPQDCVFHTYAWQWFLHLMHPDPSNAGLRNFEDRSNYKVLGEDICSGCTKNGHHPSGNTPAQLGGWFLRNIKIRERDQGTGLFRFLETGLNQLAPMSICDLGAPPTVQPGLSQALYDQFGKVVFYRVYFGSNLCTIYGRGNRLKTDRALEIKLSWRQISEEEKDNYIHGNYNLPGVGNRLLGIIGIHIAVETGYHPGFIWATFEHKQNAADCSKPSTEAGWSLTSEACAKCLQTQSLASCSQAGRECDNVNEGFPRVNTTGKSVTHICRLHPDGGADASNQRFIDGFNDQLVGPKGLLTQLPQSDPMSVLRNYFHVGTLWLIPGGDPQRQSDQRGSPQLANTSLESFQQSTNCIACHSPLNGKQSLYPVSHIFPTTPSTAPPR